MPPRKCKKCGESHTGTECVNPIMSEVLAQLKSINARVSKIESDSGGAAESIREEGPEPQASTSGEVSLKSLTTDQVLQTQVYKRINQLIGMDTDEEDDDDEVVPIKRFRGRRSGRAKTADDRVMKHIDWPHFYVYR